MAEEVERAEERLENIRGVKPILDGLRTISLGSWQAALKRRGSVRGYADRLKDMLRLLVPRLHTDREVFDRMRERVRSWLPPQVRSDALSGSSSQSLRVLALAVGSERGLCGRFNVAIADEGEEYLERQADKNADLELAVLGGRLQRIFARRGLTVSQAGRLTITTLPTLSMAFGLARQWLALYEDSQLDEVHLIYNDYRGTAVFVPTVTQLIPPQLPETRIPGRRDGKTTRLVEPWPPTIVDTDPMSLYATIVEQWTAVQLYNILLASSAAEHSTRFQLMESASQNADQLINDLTLVIQTARRQEITQEMAELAAGAGLLADES